MNEYKKIIKGELNENLVKEIHNILEEPDWLLDYRLKGLEFFRKLNNPTWGPDLSAIDFNKIIYFGSPLIYPKPVRWEELPEFIKETYRKLGLSKEYVEKAFGGTVFQFDSSPVFKKVKEYLENLGVIFMPLSEAVKEYPDLIKKYFSKIISYSENKYAALNTAVWSGGVFIYVPKNVKVDIPLHAYFRINLEGIGQFERTLIIAEENSSLTYIEGCSAPVYSTSSLHASVVEVYVHKNANVNYITLQNWSKNVYNLPTKRAYLEDGGKIKWISIELGSKVTMLYPSLILNENCVGEINKFSIAKKDQILDSGGKVFFNGKDSRAIVNSYGITLNDDSKIVHRIDVFAKKGCENSMAFTNCKSLIIKGKAESYPRFFVEESNFYYNNESKTEYIDEEKLFYLESKGMRRDIAFKTMILGYIENILEKIPDQYKFEVKRIVSFDIEKYEGIG